MTACPRCEDIGWVCEDHPERPWKDRAPAAAAVPARPACNVPEQGAAQRMPEGFRIVFHTDGWGQ
jgi:hypothetical protein